MIHRFMFVDFTDIYCITKDDELKEKILDCKLYKNVISNYVKTYKFTYQEYEDKMIISSLDDFLNFFYRNILDILIIKEKEVATIKKSLKDLGVLL